MTATEKTVAGTPAIERFALFGAPPLLDGEDAASYNEFLGRVCAAVKPVDVIDEMFVADIVFQQWEILRLRRVKTSLLRVPGHHALQECLSTLLNDQRLYADILASNLATILKAIPDGPPVDIEQLAQRCARNKKDAVDLVNALLSAVGKSLGLIVVDAKVQKLEWLVQGYAQGEPNATQQVNELFAAAHLTIDDLMAEVLLAVTDESKSKEINTLTAIERIDRLTTIAETRRNVALREFDRHSAARAQATRQALQQAEDAELIPEQATPALAPP